MGFFKKFKSLSSNPITKLLTPLNDLAKLVRNIVQIITLAFMLAAQITCNIFETYYSSTVAINRTVCRIALYDSCDNYDKCTVKGWASETSVISHNYHGASR
jgi:hypothetical protein